MSKNNNTKSKVARIEQQLQDLIEMQKMEFNRINQKLDKLTNEVGKNTKFRISMVTALKILAWLVGSGVATAIILKIL